MKLTRQQFFQVKAALLDGYDRAGLRRMVRLGLDTTLDDITSGTTDSDVVFDVIEWAERGDKVPALIQAAVEYNDQNGAIQQLKQDSSAWFAPGGTTRSAEARPAAEASPAPGANRPQYGAGGDIIVANIGGNSENIAVGKNVEQSNNDSRSQTKK